MLAPPSPPWALISFDGCLTIVSPPFAAALEYCPAFLTPPFPSVISNSPGSAITADLYTPVPPPAPCPKNLVANGADHVYSSLNIFVSPDFNFSTFQVIVL